MSYRPLAGVKVLDMGKLLPPAETTLLLASLGADVVKVELPELGDSIRDVGVQGASPFHSSMNVGKRSIALDLRREADRHTFLELARVADVIVENALAGRWAALGIDFAVLREERPQLVVCSITGFGQTGPFAALNSHGMNMDALAGVLPVEWVDGQPHMGSNACSWANELGSTSAALAITAALLEARATGQGAWIDISCWDAAVDVHRASLKPLLGGEATGPQTDRPRRSDDERGALYDTYRCADDRLVLLGTLEPKFWRNFCKGVGREDLIEQWSGTGQLGFGGTDNRSLRRDLEKIFLTAPASEWQRRFIEWDVPGGEVLSLRDLLSLPHFRERDLVQSTPDGEPYVASSIRWHHTGERAGAGLSRAPSIGEHSGEILRDWLAH